MNYKFRIVCCILLSICVFILSACKSNVIRIDKSIPRNVISARQIEEITESYAEKYLGEKYQIGHISMDISMDGRGKATLTYIDDVAKDIPNMIDIVVDTQEGKIVQVERLPKDNKLNPGKINFEDWKIDSTDALDICKEFLKKNTDYEFDNASLNTINFYKENQEIWDIILFNEGDGIAFKCKINPYTGEIIKHELVK